MVEVRNRIDIPLPADTLVKPTLPTLAPTGFDGTVNWYGQGNVDPRKLYNTLESVWQYAGTGQNGFLVQRSLDGNTGWSNLAPVTDSSARDAKHPLIERKYHYRVRASNVAGAGAPSNTDWPTFYAEDFDVKVTVSVETSPQFQIRLSWPQRAGVGSYTVWRKLKTQSLASDWRRIADGLPANSTGHADAGPEVVPGVAYEYKVARYPSATSGDPIGESYVAAGGTLMPVEDRGTVLLIVDRAIAAALESHIARLQNDLVGDGWRVVRKPGDAPRHIEQEFRSTKPVDDNPDTEDVGSDREVAQYKADLEEVRSFIKVEYDKPGSDVQAVLLLGRVTIPYSGDITRDGHGSQSGAWPADVYYGDIDGAWKDETANTSGRVLERLETYNVPGDGKFDRNYLLEAGDTDTSPVELMVGRIDLSRMSMFPPGEVDLLKRYLDKNHDFRHGEFKVPRRAVVDDNFSNRPTHTNGFQDVSALVGPGNVDGGEFFKRIQDPGSAGYLWAYASGEGLWYGAEGSNQGLGGVGDTSHYVYDAEAPSGQVLPAPPSKAVFNMLFGSFLGNWDFNNNMLRAPLAAAGYGLAAVWGGSPHHYLHHMGFGETIGYGIRTVQNNVYVGPGNTLLYTTPGNSSNMLGGTHIALMGDPTLRMDHVKPITGLTKKQEGANVRLEWSPPAGETGVFGYYIYASTSGGPFVLRSDTPTDATFYIHSNADGSTCTYMLRAVKLEEDTNSGTYYNLSHGVYA